MNRARRGLSLQGPGRGAWAKRRESREAGQGERAQKGGARWALHWFLNKHKFWKEKSQVPRHLFWFIGQEQAFQTVRRLIPCVLDFRSLGFGHRHRLK